MKLPSNEDAMIIASHYYELVKTRFGVAAIVWFEDKFGPRIARVLLPATKEKILQEIGGIFPTAARTSSPVVMKFSKNLQAFADGRAISFDTSLPDMSHVTPYHRRVLRALTKIPRGMVDTYGAIAAKTGASGGARAAGQGCANNPFPIVFPCHRVIRSDASLGGFGGGLTLKRALLEMEGVRFDSTGKVKPEFILR
jgi:methylated-DNA-[protein]-cysteine S-methyltransferase